MEQAGCADRLHAEGIAHDGTLISYGDEMFRVNFTEHTGKPVMVYGQTEVTRDLYGGLEQSSAQIVFNAEDVVIHNAHYAVIPDASTTNLPHRKSACSRMQILPTIDTATD